MNDDERRSGARCAVDHLGDNAADQPDWSTGPMCGDCYQAREMDNENWWSETYLVSVH